MNIINVDISMLDYWYVGVISDALAECLHYIYFKFGPGSEPWRPVSLDAVRLWLRPGELWQWAKSNRAMFGVCRCQVSWLPVVKGRVPWQPGSQLIYTMKGSLDKRHVASFWCWALKKRLVAFVWIPFSLSTLSAYIDLLILVLKQLCYKPMTLS